MKHLFVLANPTAGRGKTAVLLPQIEESLAAQNISYKLFTTQRKNMAQNIFDQHFNDDFTDLLIVGGDGTFHDAINSLPRFDIPVGLVQSGTGNDFSKVLGGSVRLSHQLQRALTAAPKAIDLGFCNGMLFHNGVGIGFDGAVAHRAAELKAKGGGVASYYRAIAEGLFGYRGVSMMSKGIKERCDCKTFMTTVANGVAFGGGLKVTPKASITDGLLDVCHVDGLTVGGRLWRLPFLVAGMHTRLSKISYLQTERIVIEGPEELPAHIDGEIFKASRFEISLARQKLYLRF